MKGKYFLRIINKLRTELQFFLPENSCNYKLKPYIILWGLNEKKYEMFSDPVLC